MLEISALILSIIASITSVFAAIASRKAVKKVNSVTQGEKGKNFSGNTMKNSGEGATQSMG